MIASETVLSLICISWTMWSTFFLEILMNHYKLIKSTTVVISIFEASMRCSTYIWWLNLKTNYNTPFPGMLYFSQHEQISIFGLNSLRFSVTFHAPPIKIPSCWSFTPQKNIVSAEILEHCNYDTFW